MRDDGVGFLAFILGGVIVVVLTLALIAYRAQTDRSRHASLGNVVVTMQANAMQADAVSDWAHPAPADAAPETARASGVR